MPKYNTPTDIDPFIGLIDGKNWFANDDTLTLYETETFVGDGLYEWTTESYIAICQIEQALDDPDVVVGDIDPDEEHNFKIYLYKSDECSIPRRGWE